MQEIDLEQNVDVILKSIKKKCLKIYILSNVRRIWKKETNKTQFIKWTLHGVRCLFQVP